MMVRVVVQEVAKDKVIGEVMEMSKIVIKDSQMQMVKELTLQISQMETRTLMRMQSILGHH